MIVADPVRDESSTWLRYLPHAYWAIASVIPLGELLVWRVASSHLITFLEVACGFTWLTLSIFHVSFKRRLQTLDLERSEAAAREHLLAGERIRVATVANFDYLVLTNLRLVKIRMSRFNGNPGRILWQQQRSDLVGALLRRGLFRSHLNLRDRDGHVLRLRIRNQQAAAFITRELTDG